VRPDKVVGHPQQRFVVRAQVTVLHLRHSAPLQCPDERAISRGVAPAGFQHHLPDTASSEVSEHQLERLSPSACPLRPRAHDDSDHTQVGERTDHKTSTGIFVVYRMQPRLTGNAQGSDASAEDLFRAETSTTLFIASSGC